MYRVKLKHIIGTFEVETKEAIEALKELTTDEVEWIEEVDE